MVVVLIFVATGGGKGFGALGLGQSLGRARAMEDCEVHRFFIFFLVKWDREFY